MSEAGGSSEWAVMPRGAGSSDGADGLGRKGEGLRDGKGPRLCPVASGLASSGKASYDVAEAANLRHWRHLRDQGVDDRAR